MSEALEDAMEARRRRRRAPSLCPEIVRERDEAVRQRDELRAILAPLLDGEAGRTRGICDFCGWQPFSDRRHKPDCPVLRRDALLGRDRA